LSQNFTIILTLLIVGEETLIAKSGQFLSKAFQEMT